MDSPTPDAEKDADFPLESPGSVNSDASSPDEYTDPRPSSTSLQPPHLSPRSISSNAAMSGMTPSSTPLGNVSAARRPGVPQPAMRQGSSLTSDLQARMKAFHIQRQGAPAPAPSRAPSSPQILSPPPQPAAGGVPSGAFTGGFAGPNPLSPPQGGIAGVPADFRMPNRPVPHNFASAPAVPNRFPGAGKGPSLMQRRPGPLPGGLTGPGAAATGPAKKRPGMKLSDLTKGDEQSKPAEEGAPKQHRPGESMMEKYADLLDLKKGSITFKGKAKLTSEGIEFQGGQTFNISLDQVDTLDELGKGNYGTVYKVKHARPLNRKVGQGLAGNKSHGPGAEDDREESSPTTAKATAGTSGRVMAMKEIRLELDDAKFAAIIMELDVLHRCVSPFIVDFYGAFFQEGAVYICMEFMDGGSTDKLYGDGIPENVLRKITFATTMGLKSLKDQHNIIHRDVKPTNILVNTRGQVKICDFGVSGNLVASIAKTNIGCQSYMAPERISSGGIAQAGANPGGGTYSVQSDIWSLGLSIIECALGRYPYPPETYNNIFSQLSAIVDGEPPDLPEEGFSDAARNFVRGCLNKIPALRPTYAMLLQHAWLAPLLKPPTIMEEDENEEAELSDGNLSIDDPHPSTVDKEVGEWVIQAIERRRAGKMAKSEKPALHAAPLDAVTSPTLEKTGQAGA